MVTREDKIEQTLTNFVREKLTTYNYIPNVCDLREAFPSPEERAQPMDKSQVATGFTFDNGGEPAELGTELTRYTHTVEWWSFGINETEGQNTANFIKLLFRSNMTIPLLDIGGDDEDVVIGYLEIPDARSVSTARQISRNPFPWDRWVWSTTIKIQDTYTPELL